MAILRMPVTPPVKTWLSGSDKITSVACLRPPPGLDVAPRQRVYPFETSAALGEDHQRTFVTAYGHCYILDHQRKFKRSAEAENWVIPMNLEDSGDLVQQIRAFSAGGCNWTKNLERICKCNVMLRGRGAEGAKVDGAFVPDASIESPPVVIVSAKPGEKLDRALDIVERRLEEVRAGEFDEIERRLSEAHERRIELVQGSDQQELADMKEDLKQLHSAYHWHLKQKWNAECPDSSCSECSKAHDG